MAKKEIHSSVKPTRSIIFVALLWILQSVGRVVLGYLSAIKPGGSFRCRGFANNYSNNKYDVLSAGNSGVYSCFWIVANEEMGILGNGLCQCFNNTL